jgi:hypothetical protein
MLRKATNLEETVDLRMLFKKKTLLQMNKHRKENYFTLKRVRRTTKDEQTDSDCPSSDKRGQGISSRSSECWTNLEKTTQ